MTVSQILALMPVIVLSLTAVLLMLQASVKRDSLLAWLITCAGLLAAMWGVGFAKSYTQQVTPLIVVDDWGLFFSLLILICAAVTLILSKRELGGGRAEEYYLLLVLAVLGAVVLVQSSHMASLLLGMELMGVALYAMVAFPRRGFLSLEAAIKYLVMSGCASAMLLFGFALLYAATGDLSYIGFGEKISLATEQNLVLVYAGSALVLSGLGFKLSVVPFHMWTPDVYEGAPTPVTGFLATVSKGAVFVAFTRVFVDANLVNHISLMTSLSVVAIASMLIGNLLALRQSNIKRLLSYSSIAHFGYLLIVLVASSLIGDFSYQAINFYLVAYILTTLAAFTVVENVVGAGESGFDISAFGGLFWRRPIQAVTFTVALLSLAGIPLTAGFIGKFYVITAGVQASLWGLVMALVVGSAIAIYYYLRVIFVMSKVPEGESRVVSFSGHDALALVLVTLILFLGSWPQPFIKIIGGI